MAPTGVDRAALALRAARRTRRNMFADGAFAVASGATLLIVLAILTMILFDVIRNGTPHLSWSFLTESPRALAGGMLVAVARNGIRCSAVGAGGYCALHSPSPRAPGHR